MSRRTWKEWFLQINRSRNASAHKARPRVLRHETLSERITPAVNAFFTAGILTDVPLDSPFANEELFGPIAMVFRAADIDEAIRIANDVPFGLGSSVWTDDPVEQQRFVRDIAAGMVAIDQMLASAPEAPFGGIKRSGHGRELGPFGLHEFMNLKAVYRTAGEAVSDGVE